MKHQRKITLYIAMSLDGYITDTNENLDFLSAVEKEGEDYGYSDFVNSVDTVILGRKTYEKVLSMGFEYPHTDKEVYIITSAEKPPVGNLKFFNGDLVKLINNLKIKPGKDIYCDGGAVLVNELRKQDLIDEYIISVIPVLLGGGINLFKAGIPEQNLELISSKNFEKGLVQLHYRRIR